MCALFLTKLKKGVGGEQCDTDFDLFWMYQKQHPMCHNHTVKTEFIFLLKILNFVFFEILVAFHTNMWLEKVFHSLPKPWLVSASIPPLALMILSRFEVILNEIHTLLNTKNTHLFKTVYNIYISCVVSLKESFGEGWAAIMPSLMVSSILLTPYSLMPILSKSWQYEHLTLDLVPGCLMLGLWIFFV